MLVEVPRNIVMQGHVLDKLAELPCDCVDVVVTSPPYWGLRDYGDPKQIGLEKHPSEYIAKIAEVAQEVKRVLKPSGIFWLNIGDSYCHSRVGGVDLKTNHGHNSVVGHIPQTHCGINRGYFDGKWIQEKQKMLIPARVAITLQDQGWILRNEIVWHKINHMPESVRDRLTRSWESIFFFTKSNKYHFDLDAIRKPIQGDSGWAKSKYINKKLAKTSEFMPDRLKRNGSEQSGLKNYWLKHDLAVGRVGNFAYDDPLHTKPYHSNGANPGDVWSLTTEVLKDEHFAAYPQKLVKRILSCACPKGGLVLDPFAGSGTTLLVAHKMGFDWLGIELVPKYCEIIDKRINRHGRVRLDKYVEVCVE